MITEETKLKELIPEGMEIETTATSSDHVLIMFKKKQKDFDWYVREYLIPTTTEDVGENIVDWITPDDITEIKGHFFKDEWEYLPFELKIGLLRFICDDSRVSLVSMLNYLQKEHTLTGVEVAQCSAIACTLPKEFLKSIL